MLKYKNRFRKLNYHVRFHYTSIRMPKTFKIVIILIADIDAEKLDHVAGDKVENTPDGLPQVKGYINCGTSILWNTTQQCKQTNKH